MDWQEASEALRTAKFPALAPQAVTSRVLVVDVRPEQQYRKAHAKGSLNVPLFRDIDLAKDGPLGALKAASLLSQGVPATQLNDEFVAQFTATIGDAKDVVLADAEGGTLQRNEAFPLGKESRALIAAFKIREAGAGPAKLSHMEGGLNEWARANLPTEGEGEYVIEARTPQFSGAKADATAVAYEKVKAEGGLDDLGMGGLKRGPFWVCPPLPPPPATAPDAPDFPGGGQAVPEQVGHLQGGELCRPTRAAAPGGGGGLTGKQGFWERSRRMRDGEDE